MQSAARRPRALNPEEADESSDPPELEPVARQGDRPGREQQRGGGSTSVVCRGHVQEKNVASK